MAEDHGLIKALCCVLAAMIVAGCAQRAGITGGEKDVKAPAMVRSNPDNFTTDFRAEKITVEFDEYIQLEDIRRNLIVTPVMRHSPTVIANGRKLMLKNLDDSLMPNSTYVIQFNEAIRDITENNPSKGFRYVFSTGSYIDSFQVSGEVRDAFTLQPLEDMFIYLFEDSGDSTFYREVPRYIGRSDKNGFYMISNIRQGEYKMLISSDENRNYHYEYGQEKIDFYDGLLKAGPDTIPGIKNFLFTETDTNVFLVGFGSLDNRSFYLSFNRPVDTLDLMALGGDGLPLQNLARQYASGKDSVVIWILDSTSAPMAKGLVVQADGIILDTIELVPMEEKREDFQQNFNLSSGKLDLGQNLEVEFRYPVRSFEKEHLELRYDSIPVSFTAELNECRRKLSIRAEWVEGRSYTFEMGPGSVEDINGLSCDSVVKEFSTQSLSYYGTLEISIAGLDEGRGILLLTDKRENVLKSALMGEGNEVKLFEHLKPGEYLLKLIA